MDEWETQREEEKEGAAAMNDFLRMLIVALLAITTENVLFVGGFGFSRMLRAARKPRTMAWYSVLVAFFSLVSILLSQVLSPLFVGVSSAPLIRPALYAASAAVVYVLAAFLLKTAAPRFYKKVGAILAPSAINCVVIAMPFIQRNFQYNVMQSIGFALGTGIAFLAASIVFALALKNHKNSDMPAAFSGLPAVLIYVGILSMAFVGLTGGSVIL